MCLYKYIHPYVYLFKLQLLQTLKKLNKLPITLAHLQDTGIGKTVNALRKFDGKIGKDSRDLVNKWKDVVSQEEDIVEEESYEKEDEEEEIIEKESSKLIYK